MPHIDIKHFPVDLDNKTKEEFIQSITSIVTNTFQCNQEAISIAIESVDPQKWEEQVYNSEIIRREKWLQKKPEYGSIAENQ